MSLPDVIERAAAGELPPWAEVGPKRRAHIERVAALLAQWAASAGLSAEERTRWTSVGYLHDALRDADPEKLRRAVPPGLVDLPAGILHGPAAAERLREDGVDDADLLRAVAFHTLGHPEFGRLGRALYVADFVEPGRDFHNAWRAKLRERVPAGLDGVALEVAGARIAHLVERRMELRAETVGFWNVLSREA